MEIKVLGKRKREFVEKGKKEFKFNIDKELVRYKVVSGERLTKEDNNIINDYTKKCLDTNGEALELTEDYINWRYSIVNKYKGFSKEKLEAFVFYLNHGAKMKIDFKELTTTLAMPIIVGIVLAYFESVFNFVNNPIGYILAIIGFFVLYLMSIIKGMQLIEGFNIEQEVYEEFSKIIGEEIKNK